MDEAVLIQVGSGLRGARVRAGMTQLEVAEAACLPPEAYVRMECGKLLPTVPMLVALCRALRISAEWLRVGSVSPR
ncbi:helix-turn-helix transcriptional regulator [Pyxidicoccus parkwayensis]|uniref:Helix-turn-helix transcriptional regulator n=1 Tax=Pyxidicoccus parkwayensis TaxID=2813578 RepID=A0ABX7P0P7_9BACT|nr:helix-turn-helix transcriptional regulator [Pyxidicoccus parkwaysis]QSQ24174.1 helix-turn-helix transcriptional regulator [Pyxidicoccus parkwaysis]